MDFKKLNEELKKFIEAYTSAWQVIDEEGEAPYITCFLKRRPNDNISPYQCIGSVQEEGYIYYYWITTDGDEATEESYAEEPSTDIINKLKEAYKKYCQESGQTNPFETEEKEKTFADWFGKDLTGQTYEGDIDCVGVGIISLKGAPEIINGNFDCAVNPLNTLEGAPKQVKGDFDCTHTDLTSLKNAPEKVEGTFKCERNKLVSLEGAPKIIGGSFNCEKCGLTSLQGAPEKIGGSFICPYNELTSLEGAPKVIPGNFYCYGNKLTSLKGIPKIIKGKFLGPTKWDKEAKHLGYKIN